jgi:dTDP-4-amino-4,6-dideoxygalactose transaminase
MAPDRRGDTDRPVLKTSLKELALYGAPPAFISPKYVGTPNIGNRQRFFERMNTIFDARRLTNDGPFVQQFEQSIAEQASTAHCVAVCNATTGLQIAIQACGLTGEVIVPAFTFVAAPHAVASHGLKPVFCDVQHGSHNIDPADAERRITEKTSCIIGVHLWGRPCDTDALGALARKYNLKLLFDAAHAFGCSKGDQMIGGFGDAEIFSFHGTKFINAFEGGAICTNNGELAERARLIRNFGFADYDTVVCEGVNGKMSEPSAAMGLTCLESAHQFLGANQRNFNAYREGLAGLDGVSLCTYPSSGKSTYSYVFAEVDRSDFGMTRDALQEILWAEQVLARRYFYPGCHRMEPYRSQLNPGCELPVTELLSDRVLVLPTGTATSVEDIAAICQIIRLAAANPSIGAHTRAGGRVTAV